MLLPDPIVSSHHLLLPIAVSTEAGCSDLATCVMVAIVPVNVGTTTMIVCVQQLVG